MSLRSFSGVVLIDAAVDAARLVDTTGAGDAFVGGFLYGRALRRSLDECVAAGHYAAAAMVQTRGCNASAIAVPHRLWPSPAATAAAAQ